MKRAAVIGLGDIAKVHLPVLGAMTEVEVCAVCDTDKTKSALAPNIPFFTDIDTLLKEAKPDVVHLCLPHYLHYPMAAIAAKANINVFCEKPLALNVSEAMRFADLERERSDLRFGLCLQNRYNASSQELLRIVNSGQEGAVKGIKGIVTWQRSKSYYTAAPWRGAMSKAGGGVMINQSIHTLDLMQLLGGKISAISGNICRLLDYGIEVEDTAGAHITYANGAEGLFMATVANSKNDNIEVAVSFENTEYVIADNALYKLDADSARILVCEDEKLPGTKFYYGASHAKAIGAYYAAFENNTQDYIHAAEGVMSMKMIDAIRNSCGAKIAIGKD